MAVAAAQSNDPVLEYHPKGAKGSKGWFGKSSKSKYGDENVYNRSPAEIAERYRPRGTSVNVEMPNAYHNSAPSPLHHQLAQLARM